MEDLVLGGAEGGQEPGKETSAESAERAREQKAKAASQAKRDQQNERRKKSQDDILAQIIVQFLKNPRYSGFFLLIARALSKNIPSDFLLAILALIHKDSAQILQDKNIPRKNPPKSHTSSFPPELSSPLSEWTILLYSVSTAEPHRVLETILDESWELDVNIVQLCSLVVREFFFFKKFETEFSHIQQFSENFLKTLSTDLENQIQNQQILETPEDDF